MKIITTSALKYAVAGGLFFVASAPALAALEAIDDEALSAVTGQSLFVGDFIAGNSSDPNGGRFDFHRMGLDVELALNANIDKLQLGCGGFNESITANACDIDMDYVRLMGLNANGDGGHPDGPASDFILKRPYIELAVSGTGITNREVVGIKVGSESANGYFGVGRTYANGQTNQEFGGTCNTASGSDNTGGRLNCHTGLNRISGYLNTELSGKFPLDIAGIGSGWGCFGLMTGPSAQPQCSASDTEGVWGGHTGPLLVEIIGTRVTEMRESIELDLDANLLGFITLDHAYSNVIQNLRFLHGFALDDTSDFFLSFQREKVAYPTYQKDGYAYPANAGWWMNVPYVGVRNFVGDEVKLGLFEALDALGEDGVDVENSDLGSLPPNNCYGSYGFC
ncbi:MAG: hypothetical protein KDH99_05905 [Alcanivoracaceae bacterium]|nr:hypothetical protein [Alcanivoracaceae bacterium]